MSQGQLKWASEAKEKFSHKRTQVLVVGSQAGACQSGRGEGIRRGAGRPCYVRIFQIWNGKRRLLWMSSPAGDFPCSYFHLKTYVHCWEYDNLEFSSHLVV